MYSATSSADPARCFSAALRDLRRATARCDRADVTHRSRLSRRRIPPLQLPICCRATGDSRSRKRRWPARTRLGGVDSGCDDGPSRESSTTFDPPYRRGRRARSHESGHGRRPAAEAAGHDPLLRGQFDLVTARSFGRPAVTAECAAPFLRREGLLVVSEPPDSPEIEGPLARSRSCPFSDYASSDVWDHPVRWSFYARPRYVHPPTRDEPAFPKSGRSSSSGTGPAALLGSLDPHVLRLAESRS